VRVRVVAVAAAAALCGLPACGADGGSGAAQGGAPTGSVTVLAASSLTESFGELRARFRAAHPGIDVTFSFGASSSFAAQVRNGAPVDVVATADEPSMQALVEADPALRPQVFARNRLAIAVAKGNPKGIRSLADLARPGTTVVLCAPEVPCGRLAAEAAGRAGAQPVPKSYEANVKAVLSKVALGEADAGVVYATDVRAAADKVGGVDIAAEHNVTTAYPVARLSGTANPGAADAFVAFVLSEEGREALARFGFEGP
jgi:molybdate transport system substrate-binding protein